LELESSNEQRTNRAEELWDAHERGDQRQTRTAMDGSV